MEESKLGSHLPLYVAFSPVWYKQMVMLEKKRCEVKVHASLKGSIF